MKTFRDLKVNDNVFILSDDMIINTYEVMGIEISTKGSLYKTMLKLKVKLLSEERFVEVAADKTQYGNVYVSKEDIENSNIYIEKKKDKQISYIKSYFNDIKKILRLDPLYEEDIYNYLFEGGENTLYKTLDYSKNKPYITSDKIKTWDDIQRGDKIYCVKTSSHKNYKYTNKVYVKEYIVNGVTELGHPIGNTNTLSINAYRFQGKTSIQEQLYIETDKDGILSDYQYSMHNRVKYFTNFNNAKIYQYKVKCSILIRILLPYCKEIINYSIENKILTRAEILKLYNNKFFPNNKTKFNDC